MLHLYVELFVMLASWMLFAVIKIQLKHGNRSSGQLKIVRNRINFILFSTGSAMGIIKRDGADSGTDIVQSLWDKCMHTGVD